MHGLVWASAAFQETPTYDDGGAGILGAIFGGGAMLFALAILAVVLVSLWKIFEKAGQPGWAALVPIYNLVVLLQIINKPLWWIVLFFIPCVSIVAAVLVALELAKCFGQSIGFAIGMILLPFIFYPILGFGDAQYRPPAA